MKSQILICMETNKRANTDYVYIKCTLDYYYENTKEIIFRPIYLESKTRYRDKKKQREINATKKAYKGPTSVIYCIDMDEYSVKPEDKQLLNEIKDYCEQQDYDLVLFNKDIEDVYLGQQVPNTEKVKMASQFRENNKITVVREESLSSFTLSRHQSNILNIFDKYWTRKPSG